MTDTPTLPVVRNDGLGMAIARDVLSKAMAAVAAAVNDDPPESPGDYIDRFRVVLGDAIDDVLYDDRLSTYVSQPIPADALALIVRGTWSQESAADLAGAVGIPVLYVGADCDISPLTIDENLDDETVASLISTIDDWVRGDGQ